MAQITLQLDDMVTVRGLELTRATMEKELASQHLAGIWPCLPWQREIYIRDEAGELQANSKAQELEEWILVILQLYLICEIYPRVEFFTEYISFAPKFHPF